jgi:hypothetical protein
MMKRDAQLYRETTQVRHTSHSPPCTSPSSQSRTLYFQAKINELRGALADGRGDADSGAHSDGLPFGGEAQCSIKLLKPG